MTNKPPAGATHLHFSSSTYLKKLGDDWWAAWDDEKWQLRPDGLASFAGDVFPLAVPKWDGNGRPPIGIEIETLVATNGMNDDGDDWERCTVIGYDGVLTVTRVLTGEHRGQYCSRQHDLWSDAPVFRVRQKAPCTDTERDSAITEMALKCAGSYSLDLRGVCTELFDAGYKLVKS